MAFSILSRSLLRTSREFWDRSAVGAASILRGTVDTEFNRCVFRDVPGTTSMANKATIPNTRSICVRADGRQSLVPSSSRRYSKKPVSSVSSRQDEDEESDSDSDSDDEYERKRLDRHSKTSERGDSEFWRRKMRTLHRILDVNRDGVISFDDFNLFAKRFTDLGHLPPDIAVEFMTVLQQTWEEQFGPIAPYNLVTAEQFLTDIHHRLNDKDMAKRIGRFLPFLFKAVDYDHSGHLDLDQYKLFFRCLGLTDEDAAISFAVIDKNGDGQLSMREFVHLGRQFFLTEDDTKISKMFWGPLLEH